MRAAARPSLLLVLLLAVGGCARCGGPDPALAAAEAAAARGPRLTFDGVTLRFQGQVLPLPGPLAQWARVLGPPSRQLAAPRVAVWDGLGISVWLFDTQADTVKSVGVLLQPPEPRGVELRYQPATPFRGKLVVDGAWVHAGATMLDINRDKQGLPFDEGYLPDIYGYDINDRLTDRGDGPFYYVRIDRGRQTRNPETFSIAFAADTPPDAGPRRTPAADAR